MKHFRSLATTTALTIGIGLTIGAITTNAHAADPIKKGTFALGAERLMGFSHTSASVGDADGKQTQFTLLAQNSHGPWDLPRIGFDGFITDGLSLGGTLGIMHTSNSGDALGGLVGGGYSQTDILFAPRVGYAIMFSDDIGMWPRGGFSYFHTSINPDGNGADQSGHFISLNLECPFLFFPAPAFAITVAPLLDLSVTGSRSIQTGPPANVTTTVDASYTSFGIVAGLAAFF